MHWLATSPDQTELLGAALARARPTLDDAAGIIYLSGELGSGKTTLARGFLRACGVTAAVHSPSYTLLESYEVEGLKILHVDLYRLRDFSEIEPLGLSDFERPGFIWLIEWPERAQARLPAADLAVELSAATSGHTLTANGVSKLGHEWLDRLEPIEIPTAWP
jgi:tRNA threonylcarbamoyladenosine biosynthesis protein TsaE